MILLPDVLEAQPGRCRPGDLGDAVVDHRHARGRGADLDVQRRVGMDGVVFGGVLDEELHAAGHDRARHRFLGDVHLHVQPLREPDLQQVDVLGHEIHLVAQADGGLVLAADHVAVDFRELVRVAAGVLARLLLDEVVQHVERVEEEMRVDLLLELVVAVLGEVGQLGGLEGALLQPQGIGGEHEDDDERHRVVEEDGDGGVAAFVGFGEEEQDGQAHHQDEDEGDEQPLQGIDLLDAGRHLAKIWGIYLAV